MRSARAARLPLFELVLSEDEPVLDEEEPEALGSVLVLPEVDEPEAPMPDELLLGVLEDELGVLDDELGVLDEELLGEVVEDEPAPIVLELLGVLLLELLGVLLELLGVELELLLGVLEEPAPMPDEPVLPPVLGAVELLLPLVPEPLLEAPPPEEPDAPEDWAAA